LHVSVHRDGDEGTVNPSPAVRLVGVTVSRTCVALALVGVVAAMGCSGGSKAKSDAGASPADGSAGSSGADGSTARSDAATDAPASRPDVADAAPEGATPDGASDARPESASDATTDSSADGGLDADSDAVPRVARRALTVAVGLTHTCALLEDHTVKCWGENPDGELGLGDTRSRGASAAEMGDALPAIDLGTGRTATSISAGRNATCAILDDGTLKCWGMGALAGFGLGIDNNRGDAPGEMGDALPIVDLGPARTAKRVAVGRFVTCVERDDETLKCWGTDTSAGEIGRVAGAHIVDLVGGGHVWALYDDGSVRGFAVADPAPGAGVDLGAGQRAVGLAAGAASTCALLVGGGIKCWGALTSALPPASETFVGLELGDQSDSSCGLAANGVVSCWGVHEEWGGAPAANGGFHPRLGEVAATVAGGGTAHACALSEEGLVKCWGWSSPVAPELGASFTDKTFDGTWRDIDLGTRPAPPQPPPDH